jgi:hypothetical protein
MQDPDPDPKLPSKSDPEPKKSFRINNTDNIRSHWLCFKEMGVGLAVFREGGEVTYYNLWLPALFPLLCE